MAFQDAEQARRATVSGDTLHRNGQGLVLVRNEESTRGVIVSRPGVCVSARGPVSPLVGERHVRLLSDPDEAARSMTQGERAQEAVTEAKEHGRRASLITRVVAGLHERGFIK